MNFIANVGFTRMHHSDNQLRKIYFEVQCVVRDVFFKRKVTSKKFQILASKIKIIMLVKKSKLLLLRNFYYGIIMINHNVNGVGYESCVIPLSAKCRRLNIDWTFGILGFCFDFLINFGSTFLI